MKEKKCIGSDLRDTKRKKAAEGVNEEEQASPDDKLLNPTPAKEKGLGPQVGRWLGGVGARVKRESLHGSPSTLTMFDIGALNSL